jgi:hypothetical protein
VNSCESRGCFFSSHHPSTDGPPRQLAHAVAAPAIDLLVPLALDLFGRAAEALDGQPITLRRGDAVHSMESIVQAG